MIIDERKIMTARQAQFHGHVVSVQTAESVIDEAAIY